VPRKPAPPPNDPEQSKRFIEMAREVEAEGSMDDLERAFKAVAKEKPAPKKPKG
jgi:hypothetical protein